MRLCLVYDCLYPHTVGGAERWMRALAEGAVAAGHEVTYLTRMQWDPSRPPDVPGVEVVAVSGPDELYDAAGDRLVRPGLAFAAGVARHLARHRREYDLVHAGNFPYFHLFAARLVLRGVPLVVDWHEVLSAAYLHRYLGPVRGRAARAVQRACVAATPEAYCFSAMTEGRLRAAGVRRVTRLPGLLPDPPAVSPRLEAVDPVHVVYAGRHVADKRVLLLPGVVAALRRSLPDASATVLGGGPLTEALRAERRRLGLDGAIRLPGRVPAEAVAETFRDATCLLLPSSREGYGMVVGEAAWHGTPSVVVAGPDNAAVDLVEPGVTGLVADVATPEHLAEVVLDVHRAGATMRASTVAWWQAHGADHLMSASIAQVLRRYAEPGPLPS